MSRIDHESLMLGWKLGRMVAKARGGGFTKSHVFNPDTGTLVILKDDGSCSYSFYEDSFNLEVTEEVYYG